MNGIIFHGSRSSHVSHGNDDSPWPEHPVSFTPTWNEAFPLETLPEPWRSLVSATATEFQVPLNHVAGILLCMGAAAASRTHTVLIKPGWSEPLNLYLMALLRSGHRKSALLSRLLACLREFERTSAEQIAPLHRRRQHQLEALQQRLKDAVAKSGQDGSGDGEAEALAAEIQSFTVPAVTSLFTEDETEEAHVRHLVEQGETSAIFSSEVMNFLDNIGGRYNSGRASFGLYLRAHSGDSYTSGRVHRQRQTLHFPRLTFCLLAQPAFLLVLRKVPLAEDSGLLARWLVIPENDLLGSRDADPPLTPQDLEERHRAGMQALYQRAYPSDGHVPQLKQLRVSDEGRESLLNFSRRLEPCLAKDRELAHMASWASKLTGQVARIAGVLHLMGCASTETDAGSVIPAETARAAVRIGEFFLAGAKVVFATSPGGVVAKVATIWAWVERKKKATFSRGEAYKALRNSGSDQSEDLEPALERLEADGYLRKERVACTGKAGRPIEKQYVVNPRLFAQWEVTADAKSNMVNNVDKVSTSGSMPTGGSR